MLGATTGLEEGAVEYVGVYAPVGAVGVGAVGVGVGRSGSVITVGGGGGGVGVAATLGLSLLSSLLGVLIVEYPQPLSLLRFPTNAHN